MGQIILQKGYVTEVKVLLCEGLTNGMEVLSDMSVNFLVMLSFDEDYLVAIWLERQLLET